MSAWLGCTRLARGRLARGPLAHRGLACRGLARRSLARGVGLLLAAAGALVLAGCVTSDRPLLTGGEKIYGETTRLQTYGLHGGAAHEPSLARLRWTGQHYRVEADDKKDDKNDGAMSFHRLGGNDFLIQAVDDRPGRAVEYALAREIAEGVLLVAPLDEDLVAAEIRARNCPPGGGCKVTSAEALRALAQAQAALPFRKGGLAIRLADDDPK